MPVLGLVVAVAVGAGLALRRRISGEETPPVDHVAELRRHCPGKVRILEQAERRGAHVPDGWRQARTCGDLRRLVDHWAKASGSACFHGQGEACVDLAAFDAAGIEEDVRELGHGLQEAPGKAADWVRGRLGW